MALLDYKSETKNGGRMVNIRVSTNAGFDDYNPETMGTRDEWRKFFLKNTDSTPIPTAYVYLNQPTANTSSYAILTLGTQTDTVSTKSERIYGAGTLNADVLPEDIVMVVDCEITDIFQIDDVVIYPDVSFVRTIADIVYDGLQATITLDGNVGVNLFAGDSISSAIVVTNVTATADNFVKTFSTSTFNESLVTLNNQATIEENITVTITGVNSFSVISTRRGVLPNGSRLADYQPLNPNFALPYFVLPAAAWGGTATIGEEMTFSVHPSAIPIWINENITDTATADDVVLISYKI